MWFLHTFIINDYPFTKRCFSKYIYGKLKRTRSVLRSLSFFFWFNWNQINIINHYSTLSLILHPQALERMRQLHKRAKNVILFIGDGMGISTLTASRIFMAQQRNLTGEEAKLSWERFLNVALSKVGYTVHYIICYYKFSPLKAIMFTNQLETRIFMKYAQHRIDPITVNCNRPIVSWICVMPNGFLNIIILNPAKKETYH